MGHFLLPSLAFDRFVLTKARNKFEDYSSPVMRILTVVVGYFSVQSSCLEGLYKSCKSLLGIRLLILAT